MTADGVRILALLAIAFGFAGCASPTRSIEEYAIEHGLGKLILEGNGMRHVAFHRAGKTDRRGPLHVYLEGDGTPWMTRTRIASDPTARKPVALRLMTLDQNPSLYLGRPCYNGMAASPSCTAWFWTNGRYSERVVGAMAAAIRRFQRDHRSEGVRLIGYSGGGVLAMLLAEKLDSVDALVTVAANLDTDAWTKLHGYTHLSSSLNPAKRAGLPAHIRQLHLAGADDGNVPPELVRSALGAQKSPIVVEIPNVDHGCCWETLWPSILAWVDSPQRLSPPLIP